jgi:hypothetical protein
MHAWRRDASTRDDQHLTQTAKYFQNFPPVGRRKTMSAATSAMAMKMKKALGSIQDRGLFKQAASRLELLPVTA